MHARIDHLLSLRDRLPTEAWVAGHVERCPSCAAQLRRLEETRSSLQSLPQLDAPATSWKQIQARMNDGSAQTRRFRLRYAAAAASLLVLGLVVALIVRQSVVHPDAREAAATSPSPQVVPGAGETSNVNDLVARSQRLDNLLEALPERPRIERVSTAATIETIEQRIQWLDFQLSYAHEQGLNEQQAQRLWSERVELMDSLVKVRSAESGGISF